MNYLGGYLLFPSTQTYAGLVQAILQAMELTPVDIEVLLPREGYAVPIATSLPIEQALVELGHRGGGINVLDETRPETYWLEPAAGPYSLSNLWVEDEPWFKPVTGPYPVMNISIAEPALRNQSPYTSIDQLAERWLRLCEQGHAIYGYFSRFELRTERDFLDEHIFPHLQADDLSQLLEDSDENWLVYVGPELAKRWQQEHIRWPTSWSSPQPFLTHEQPSGAQFIRTSEGVFGEK
ncbi:hypothetical protein KDA_35790 [Dictyobacter alpinus]|uniref:Uncharacterized protein n=1 Tax=Dictyobacter alpinus TaxID=2014873 RepID=A0A402B9S0_9CHLR|nr:hypothetical protein [Dictyobacter alpinus]GCE28095.1 hypothetical protein KDA_35790 [Dictyobacter alpinus]